MQQTRCRSLSGEGACGSTAGGVRIPTTSLRTGLGMPGGQGGKRARSPGGGAPGPAAGLPCPARAAGRCISFCTSYALRRGAAVAGRRARLARETSIFRLLCWFLKAFPPNFFVHVHAGPSPALWGAPLCAPAPCSTMPSPPMWLISASITMPFDASAPPFAAK